MRDECIDVAVSLEAIYTLRSTDDQLRCLDDVRRVLKADGLFVCSVPIEIGLPAVVKYVGRRTAGVGSPVGFRDMLKHWLHPVFDLSGYPCGGLWVSTHIVLLTA